eukprot:CAMPEP_0170749778 /NCGR_PEP_ID=MMETSP0437-20130122/10577_1 /TAXON_ID=0 /ORGANISM="Sexangularia sp." /LENGTH=155 /DNA_ID=CAMNT_0011088725 /DNA_START=88 /DNA_END=555 /DNA_ORIENTATION=+
MSDTRRNALISVGCVTVGAILSFVSIAVGVFAIGTVTISASIITGIILIAAAILGWIGIANDSYKFLYGYICVLVTIFLFSAITNIVGTLVLYNDFETYQEANEECDHISVQECRKLYDDQRDLAIPYLIVDVLLSLMYCCCYWVCAYQHAKALR